ncbi:MAG TPA: DUF393 domain-containing protein [Planctomycetota bacterium]|nr:DUF393 domain-containing protein [Planctomycetota bacterium]
MAATTLPRRGWVLYDGQCGFCAGWIRRVKGTLERHGFLTDTLQAPWVGERLNMPMAELLKDIRLLTTDGKLINGADAYLYVLRRIWWLFPLGVLFALPGLKQLFWFVYRRVAQNRYCIGGKCELPHR